MDPTDYERDDRRLLWRIWWRLGFSPLIRLIDLIPIANWRRDLWIWRLDVWAMDHIGKIGRK